MTEPLVPVARPLLLCEEVLPDSGKGKVHLWGVFNALRSAESPPFPYEHPAFCVFVQLSDFQGLASARIEIVEAETLEPIFTTTEHAIRFPHRRAVIQALFRLQNCTFPRPGIYWVELYCQEVFVADQVLHLLEPRE